MHLPSSGEAAPYVGTRRRLCSSRLHRQCQMVLCETARVLLGCWLAGFAGLLACWAAGLLGCWAAGLLGCWALVGVLVGCLVGCLVVCLVGWLVGWLVGCLFGLLVGWFVGWLVWLVGWVLVVGCSTPLEHDCAQSIRVLGSIVEWTADCITWEADPRHAELIRKSA